MFNFYDLKAEKQNEFISEHLPEILFRQRQQSKLSQQYFLKKYFGYDIYHKKSGILSLSQLKRYEKSYSRKEETTIIPKKNSKIFDVIRDLPMTSDIYKEKVYQHYLEKDSLRFANNLEELGLLDCIEKATSGLVAMNSVNKRFGKHYTQIQLLNWVFANAKKSLIGEDIPELIYEDTTTRHDIHSPQKENQK